MARPRPVPPVLRGARRVAAIKPVEHMRQRFGGDAVAVILNHQYCRGFLRFGLHRQTDLNRGLRRAVLQCVQQQVTDQQPAILRGNWNRNSTRGQGRNQNADVAQRGYGLQLRHHLLNAKRSRWLQRAGNCPARRRSPHAPKQACQPPAPQAVASRARHRSSPALYSVAERGFIFNN